MDVESPVLVHEIDHGAVVHKVVVRVRAVFADFGEEHPISAGDVGDLLSTAGQADDRRVEVGDVGAHVLRPIARGIDGDEQGREAVRLVTQQIEGVGDRAERRRTHVGTIGVAEEDQHAPAAEIGVGYGAAVVIDEGERPADHHGRRRGTERGRTAAGRPDGPAHKHPDGDGEHRGGDDEGDPARRECHGWLPRFRPLGWP